MGRFLALSLVLGSLLLTGMLWAQTPLTYISTAPCRVFDTRWQPGPFGGPALAANTIREIIIPNNRVCGIPNSALAYALNVTVVPSTTLGWLTMWPTGQQQPFVSTLNSYDGRIKAAAAFVAGGVNNSISVSATNTTDLILDINGYFVGPGDPYSLQYYPLMRACELVNTFNPPTPDGLSGPALQAGVARSFTVTASSNCTVPPEAEAYSLNVIASPVNNASLDYLTIWPSDHAQPFTSTLNAPTGTTVANAAIVAAGTGALSLFASNADTNVQVELNGYFAQPSPAEGLALYPLPSPCRGMDTRPTLFTNRLDYVLQSQGGCQSALPPLPSRPRIGAFVLNATVVPETGLGFLPIWPYGAMPPLASTVVALDAAVTSNMAIVPNGLNAEISAFSSAPTNLIYDLMGYFASPDLTILTQPPLPSGIQHEPYPPFVMSARGGIPPYTWNALTLPPGLSIDPASGVISGCPTAAGGATPTIAVTDSALTPAPPSVTALTVAGLTPLTITTAALPNGTLHVPYSVNLEAAGGYGSQTWTLVAGSLPPGFSMTSDGVISGYDANTRGTFPFTVGVADQQCSAPTPPTKNLGIRIN